jgi:hypothetical protein
MPERAKCRGSAVEPVRREGRSHDTREAAAPGSSWLGYFEWQKVFTIFNRRAEPH